ncbi:putative surface protein with fasciclin (FAS1) repeats [Mariniflexile fucanivorans]|uniref:Putative surface protein with fasciclin (FAS1) repeats n=1 Tax=Mariniflexile fucanivorans TaxID=264023 RepID=A0A4R1RP44_9FLAO|nr:fasciclin domain-containing protein [Mariniflexile fucanivorans]TCL68004.1 putative surface protein with fasciclin (FAS1) repeats [Mariniflexile fucanivorans]
MKKIKFISKLSLIAFALFAIVSCDDDDDPVKQPETIAEIAAATPGFETLVAALDRADLVVTLDSPGAFTVFAPTNTAFQAFLTANNFASLEAIPVDVLKQVLLNHVVAGKNVSSGLTTGYVNSLATYGDTNLNLSMFINTSNGVEINGVSSVTTPDIDATNGVIHIVDAVIGLPTVVTFATADPTFSTLVAALTRESSFTFVNTLSSTSTPAPFTVFAPTNTAFGNLLTELEVANLAAIPTATLSATLSMHVVAGANVQSTALTNNMTITTLGGNITAKTTGGATLTDANNRVSNIIAVNVQAVNGVIHAIDKVILPNLQ